MIGGLGGQELLIIIVMVAVALALLLILTGSRRAPPPAAPPPSTADRLRELENLRDEGLITAEEYEERRASILEEL